MVHLQHPLALSGCTSSRKAVRRTNIQIQGLLLLLFIPCVHVAAADRTMNLTQVTYDLNQIDLENLPPLRDTLVAALEHYQNGPRTIIVQLCLALSGLALQLPSWTNAIPSLIESFGRNPLTVPLLLQFLTVLPEELCTNTKIPVTVSVPSIACRWPLISLLRIKNTGKGQQFY